MREHVREGERGGDLFGPSVPSFVMGMSEVAVSTKKIHASMRCASIEYAWLNAMHHHHHHPTPVPCMHAKKQTRGRERLVEFEGPRGRVAEKAKHQKIHVEMGRLCPAPPRTS